MKLTLSTFSKSLVTLGLLSLATLAQAEQPQTFDYSKASTNYADNTSPVRDFFDRGYYIGGTIGQSEATTYCDGPTTDCEDSDSAWKIFGGYKVMDKVSVEATFLNLGDIRKNNQNSDVSAFAAYGVGTLPVTERFDAFAKLGGVYWKSENTDGNQTGFGLGYGFGAKMALNETTKIRAEWEKVTDIETSGAEDSDINMLSVGFEFNTF